MIKIKSTRKHQILFVLALFCISSRLFSFGIISNNNSLLLNDTIKEQIKFSEIELLKIKITEAIKFYDSLYLDSLAPINIHYPGFINKVGDSNKYILPIKKRLGQLSLYAEDSITMKFDSTLYESLKQFQMLHNLMVDGVPGPKTYSKLKWEVSDYIKVLNRNFKKLQKDTILKSSERIVVNLPSFELKFYFQDSLLFQSDVIIGKRKTPTPLIESEIDYLVFNPCWTLPHSIAIKYVLPGLIKDSTYLKKRNMFITQHGERIIYDSIDFSLYNKENFPFKVFQNAGPGNALGKVKFMFDNKYHVYLHDTPDKHLFSRQNKCKSNGCVRVNRAEELAEIIMHNMDTSDHQIPQLKKHGYPTKYYLKNKPKLYVTYYTVGFNPIFNQLVFYDDVYKLN